MESAYRILWFVGLLLMAGLLAFGVNPAEAGHIVCGETVGPGNVKMDGNIGPCNPVGIKVVSKTNLDGNGFLIYGPGFSVVASIGIDLTGSKEVRIKNVAVENFETGISIDNTDLSGLPSDGKNKIETSRIANNMTGIEIVKSSKNKIKDNLLAFNSTCISLSGSDKNEVKSNMILGAETGISLSDSDRNEIEKNHSSFDDAGIALTDGSIKNKIKRNQLTLNNNADLSADGTSSPNTYKDNVCDSETGSVPATACQATP